MWRGRRYRAVEDRCNVMKGEKDTREVTRVCVEDKLDPPPPLKVGRSGGSKCNEDHSSGGWDVIDMN
jgi:hypothetical protein